MIRVRVNNAEVENLRRKLSNAANRCPSELARALYQETNIELTEVKRRTPVDTNALRSSEFVMGPVFQKNEITTAIVAGGPSAEYAIYVHEDLDAHHDVGEAKYIERPLFESAPHFPARVARRIELNRLL